MVVGRRQPRRRRLFLDTPTFVLGAANPGGAAAAVLALCERGTFQAVTARPLLWEARRLLRAAGPTALARFYWLAAAVSPELTPMGGRRRGALAAARRAHCGHFITLRPGARAGPGAPSSGPQVASPRDFLDGVLAEREATRRTAGPRVTVPPVQIGAVVRSTPAPVPVEDSPVAAPPIVVPEGPVGKAAALAQRAQGLDERLQGLYRERRLYQRSGFNALLLDDQIVPLERERLELVGMLRSLGVEMAAAPAPAGWRHRLTTLLRRLLGR